MANFLAFGLGSTSPSTDEQSAQALGLTTSTAFTTPMLAVTSAPSIDKTMLYLTAAGVVLAALALLKKG